MCLKTDRNANHVFSLKDVETGVVSLKNKFIELMQHDFIKFNYK